MIQRRLVLGDIHGEIEALEEVLRLSSFNADRDVLIQVGDICDRGSTSYEVVELLQNFKQLILIEGNHDQWFKNYLNSGMKYIDNMWAQQGAKSTLASYSKNGVSPLEHIAFYQRQVPYYIDEENNCFVHGGFDRNLKISEQDEEELAWNRELAEEMMNCKPGQKLLTADNFKHIYIGHTPTIYWNETKPISRGGITNLDTGCGKGGMLTIMDIANGEYWQSSPTES